MTSGAPVTAPALTPDPDSLIGQTAAASHKALLAARYARSLDVAVVVIVAGWHVFGIGVPLLVDRNYPPGWAQKVAWLTLALVIAAASLRRLRDRNGQAGDWLLAAMALATAVALLGWPTGRIPFLHADWAWNASSWAGTLILLRRPLAELVAFLTADALVAFAGLAHHGLSRVAVAGFIMVFIVFSGIQLAVAAAARAMTSAAAYAAQATQRDAKARAQAVVTAQVHAARLARWQALQASAVPLLWELASGAADPDDEQVRQRCAVEAARLRRLMAESDDVATPLRHELHAAAVMAERRGVAVDIEVAGVLPDVPADVRRVITDTAITVLTATGSRARVTLTSLDGPPGTGITVSLVADAPPQPDPIGRRGDAEIDQAEDGDQTWTVIRWTGR
jgi:hypothetical protein